METAIPTAIASVIACIIIAISQRKAKKGKAEIDPNDFIVRRPKLNLIIYIIGTAFFFLIFIIFCIPAALDKTNSEGIIAVYCIAPLPLLGILCITLWRRWKIIIKNNQITFTPFFSKTKTFTFDHITSAKLYLDDLNGANIEIITAYHEKKRLFFIPNTCQGYNALASRLKEKIQ